MTDQSYYILPHDYRAKFNTPDVLIIITPEEIGYPTTEKGLQNTIITLEQYYQQFPPTIDEIKWLDVYRDALKLFEEPLPF